MKTTSFNTHIVREMRIDLERALKAVADKYDVSIDLGRIGFESNQFTARLTCLTKTNRPELNDIMNPSLLASITKGTKFRIRTSVFEVIEVRENRPKYKFVAMNENGTRYKFSEADIRSHIQKGI